MMTMMGDDGVVDGGRTAILANTILIIYTLRVRHKQQYIPHA